MDEFFIIDEKHISEQFEKEENKINENNNNYDNDWNNNNENGGFELECPNCKIKNIVSGNEPEFICKNCNSNLLQWLKFIFIKKWNKYI